MKEQVQIPFDSRGDTTEKDKASKPKALSKPDVAQNLRMPKAKGMPMYMRCAGCSSPVCDVPSSPNTIWTWDYYDINNERIWENVGPQQGPRFLPGGPS